MGSLDCLTEQCISLLHKNNLLKPLIKSELVKSLISTVSIEERLKNKKVWKFTQELGITDQDEFDNWLSNNMLNKEDVENLALHAVRLKRYCKENFRHQSESRFLERKSDLDIIVYSLIRVKDYNLARELYLRIAEEEADFATLARQYSEGIESKTNGIVGPVPLGTAHPKMVELLKSSKPGELQAPMQIDQSVVVVRVESLDTAQLDDFMRQKMEEELFNNWIEAQVNDMSENLLKKTKSNERKEIV